ncbi:molecular chaperone [Pseudescherichia vulneris]|uniref:fimbrial biogenesis chaperone n=1 Tax=Pseudescherichia vulneris TaxID=566 RepID=UPI00301AE769
MSLPGWLNIRSVIGFFLLFTSSLAGAAIQLQQTRLVYPEGEPSVALIIKNSDVTHSVAIESWIESGRHDITITPVTMIVKPDSKRALNIHIPERGHNNQESLYWLNVKGTPLSGGSRSEQLKIAVINRIKVFYRPQKLMSGAADAYERISVSACRMQLTIKNPTPYFINFYAFNVDNKEVSHVRTIGPYEIQSVLLPTDKHSVAQWQAILDTGFHSSPVSKKIKTNCSGY